MSFTVLYGTELGMSEEAADLIAREALCRGIGGPITVAPMDAVPVVQWPSVDGPLILVCSTTGHGSTPSTMRETWGTLRMSDAPELHGVRFAVFGLGDSTYQKYNFAAKILHNRLMQLNAVPIIHRGLGDEQDPFGYEHALVSWLDSLWIKLNLVQRRFTADEMPKKWSVHVEAAVPQPNGGNSSLPPRMAHSISMCIISNERITSADHFQDVRRIILHPQLPKTSSSATASSFAVPFCCGDSLSIFPVNPAHEVDWLVKYFELRPNDRVTLSLNPKYRVKYLGGVPSFAGVQMPARDLFSACLAICQAPGRLFFSTAARFALHPEEQEKLEELATDYFGAFLPYCYKERRTFSEVLQEFPSVKMPLEIFVNLIGPLRPRRYSIASSPSDPLLTIVVAVVEFSTPYKRIRKGLCSNYLADAPVGSVLQCFIDQSDRITLPGDSMTPLILVGTGTGVALLRSVVIHCAAIRRQAPIWLFVGHRFRSKDFIFAENWEQIIRDGNVQLFLRPSFSRGNEQPAGSGKTMQYVQHKLVEEQAIVSKLIAEAGAYIIVCGNARKMAVDVEDTIRSILLSGGNKEYFQTPKEVSSFLSQMRTDGRYQLKIWV